MGDSRLSPLDELPLAGLRVQEVSASLPMVLIDCGSHHQAAKLVTEDLYRTR